MVHPQEGEALDYVGRILSYVNYTMMIEAIAADAHRRILSAYLNHKNTSQLNAKQMHQPTADLDKSSQPTTFLTPPTSKGQEGKTSEAVTMEFYSLY